MPQTWACSRLRIRTLYVIIACVDVFLLSARIIDLPVPHLAIRRVNGGEYPNTSSQVAAIGTARSAEVYSPCCENKVRPLL